MGDPDQGLEACTNGQAVGDLVTPIVIDDVTDKLAPVDVAEVEEMPAKTMLIENETGMGTEREVTTATTDVESNGIKNGNENQLEMDDNDGRTQEERDQQRLKALGWLRQAVGNPEADFHDGQWEAIDAVANRHQRVVVIQRTGWGKSSVYFIATRLLREEQKRGPTLIISPLLALMRNQVDSAGKLGIRSATLNSSNPKEWEKITTDILDDKVCLQTSSIGRDELFKRHVHFVETRWKNHLHFQIFQLCG